MVQRTKERGRSVLAAGLALAVLAGGCASSVPRREAGASGGRQAASWDLVLPGPQLALAGPGPETARRDEALQWTGSESSLTRALASPYGPPDLVRSRRLTMPRDPFGHIYYLDLYGGPRR